MVQNYLNYNFLHRPHLLVYSYDGTTYVLVSLLY